MRTIAILSNLPADHISYTGGVGTATAALVEGLRAYTSEFNFHVVSASAALRADICEERDDVTYRFVGGLHRPWLRPRLPLRVFKAGRLVRRLMPDLVHCQGNPELALAAILAGHQPLLTIHGVASHEAHLRTGWDFWSTQMSGLIQRTVARRMRAYVCNSLDATSVVGHGRPTFAIPNAVSSVFFDEGERPAIPQASPRLVFVGVLAPLKRPADLLQAHAALRRKFPTLVTFLVGPSEDAGYTRRLTRLVAEQRIEGVRFTGLLSHDKLVPLLRGATALVLPSAQENAPMAIAEAMALGVPVVATSVGGVPEMVTHDVTGQLYQTGDVRGLIERLERLLGDVALCERLGRQARHAALTRYTPAAVARETVAVYRRILDEDSTVNTALRTAQVAGERT
jgi:glycosyltransferase involved in cell wall biosynthesis